MEYVRSINSTNNSCHRLSELIQHKIVLFNLPVFGHLSSGWTVSVSFSNTELLFFFKLEKLPPYGWRFFSCSLRLQWWFPSGRPKFFENPFENFCGNPFGKFCRNLFKFFCGNPFDKSLQKSVCKILQKYLLKIL